MTQSTRRPTAIITGANGGMGRASARLIGATMDLVLTDATPALEDFVRELRADGHQIRAAIVGDLGAPEILDQLTGSLGDGFDVLIHTAGLGPSAEWRSIMSINYVATVRLLDALRPLLRPGIAAVLIASIAGHMAPRSDTIEAVLADPLSSHLCDDLEPLLLELAGNQGARALGLLSYSLSKKKVIDLCVAHATDWGSAGARIVSISPGMIFTPMGRQEAATDPYSDRMISAAPIGRWGTSMEIAAAANFLISPSASFITGTDLKIDGGSMAKLATTSSPDALPETLRAK